VTLFERNRPEDTFGFGVVFSDATLAAIHEADPVLRTALADHGRHWDDIEVRLKGRRVLCGGNGMAAITRMVLAGLGGTAAEALADVAIRLAPLSVAEAAGMPDGLAARALLDGWRGGPVLDRAEFGRIAARLAATLVASRDTAEIEINPLRLTADGLIALDAVIVPTAPPAEENHHA
jgi:hypothetical protein